MSAGQRSSADGKRQGRFDDGLLAEVRAVTIATVAPTFGIKLNAKGRSPCPFRTPRSDTGDAFATKDAIFFCHDCETSGDVITLVKRLAGLDFAGAVRRIAEIRGIPIPDGAPSAADRQRQEQRQAEHEARVRARAEKELADRAGKNRDARRLWKEGEKDLTPAASYFAARGIGDFDLASADLRLVGEAWHPDCPTPTPCIVGLVTKLATGKPAGGVHRTYLDPDFTKKLGVGTAKLSLGTIAGGCVVLRRGDPARVLVAEGMETAMAAALRLEADGEIPADCTVVSALSAGGIKRLELPEGVELVIAADNDESATGIGAARALAARVPGARIFMPDDTGTDFADGGKYSEVSVADDSTVQNGQLGDDDDEIPYADAPHPADDDGPAQPTDDDPVLEDCGLSQQDQQDSLKKSPASPAGNKDSGTSRTTDSGTGPAGGPAGPTGMVIRRVDDITEQPPEPKDIFFPGLLVRGEQAIAGGFGGSGSSALLCNFAMAVANGRPFLEDDPIPQGKVLLVEYEDAQWRIRERLKAVAKTTGGSVENIYVANLDVGQPATAKNLVAEIKHRQIDVVLIATFAALARGDDSFTDEADNAKMARVARSYSLVARRTNAALLTVAHCRKGSSIETFTIDDIRGGSALTREARMVAAFGQPGRDRQTDTEADAGTGPALWLLKWGKENVGLRKPDCCLSVASADGECTFRRATRDEVQASIASRAQTGGLAARESVKLAIDDFLEDRNGRAGEWFSRADILAHVIDHAGDLAEATCSKWVKRLLPKRCESRNRFREWRLHRAATAAPPHTDADARVANGAWDA